MNTVIDIPQKFDEWPDDSSSWTSPIFTSFGEMPLFDQQLWTVNSSQKGELGHGLDATDNVSFPYNSDFPPFDSGCTIDNFANLGPGAGSSGLVFSQQNLVSSPIGQLDHPNPTNNSCKRPYSSESHESLAGEDVVFDDNLSTSTATAPSKQLSRSPKPRKSPCHSPQSIASSMGSINETVDRTSPVSTIAETPIGTTGNKRNRERNRVAAHKCRQKAKRSMSKLQELERELGSQNRVLQEHVAGLRDEILNLKNEILRHSNCDSEVIQNYITRAARDMR